MAGEGGGVAEGCNKTTLFCIIDSKIKSRQVELDPQPRRDHEQGGGAGLRKLDFFRFGLLLNSSATDIVFVTLPKYFS